MGAQKTSLVPSPHFPTGHKESPSGPGLTTSPTAPPAMTTSQKHIVVVMMENHSYSDIIGSSDAPFLHSLAASGANLAGMFAITHPSQPNYVALFSGGQQGVTSDSCPQTLYGANLYSQIVGAKLSFGGYSEGLPDTGSTVCSDGLYARRHSPWTNWPTIPGKVSQPFTSFPTDFSALPALSFVVPNLDHDMHNGTVAAGDSWLHSHLQAYAAWASTHNSQLIITWDEDDHSENNQIPTLIVGDGIGAQKLSTHVTLYSLLRYIEDQFGLPHLGKAASASPISLQS